MKTKFTRVAIVGAALAASMTGLASSNVANAAPPLGANTLTPSTGTTSTTFTLLPPSGASCSGPGSGVPAYRWQTFMVSSSVDASTLTYGAGPNAVAGAFVSPLYDSAGGNPVINKNPSAPSGQITGIPTFSFASVIGTVPAGAYKIGFACTVGGALDAGKYWETPITVSNVTAGAFDYSFGSVPSAPVLGALTPGDQTLDGSFTPSASTPATTGFTVTATSSGNPTVTLPVAAGATTFSLTGLVNGATYSVTIVAANSVGSSAPSAPVTGTPNPAARPAVGGLSAVPGTGSVTLNWTTPTGVAPTGYSIDVTLSGSPIAGSPFSAAAGATTFTASSLTPGSVYSFTVTPLHSAPYVGTPASITGVPNAAQVIIQTLSAVRPIGALVLTQRCGVSGALPAETRPGFGSIAAATATVDTTGTAPTLVGGAADPLFSQYPYPVDANGDSIANYSTNCALNLGTGKLVTSGPLAGQYFATTGRLNQVTVVDTRDIDTGWTINGKMSNFVGSTGDTFNGNYLGWTPVMSGDSSATSGGYDQAVTAGPSVAADTQVNGLGSTTGGVLASAPSGFGLGIATLDARLALLIPVTANAGTYTGTLTFTAV